jgi:hypothetical protein
MTNVCTLFYDNDGKANADEHKLDHFSTDFWVVLKFIAGVLYWLLLVALLDWDVACFRAAYYDAATAIVTCRQLTEELEKQGQSQASISLFFVRVSQKFAAGKLPTFRVFGMPISRELLVRFMYIVGVASAALLQVNGIKVKPY